MRVMICSIVHERNPKMHAAMVGDAREPVHEEVDEEPRDVDRAEHGRREEHEIVRKSFKRPDHEVVERLGRLVRMVRFVPSFVPKRGVHDSMPVVLERLLGHKANECAL
eukprot:Amastigsp_a3574_31.p3 type:complete len:109 gc:universal Amastigsp_a3574_31:995-669(-)